MRVRNFLYQQDDVRIEHEVDEHERQEKNQEREAKANFYGALASYLVDGHEELVRVDVSLQLLLAFGGFLDGFDGFGGRFFSRGVRGGSLALGGFGVGFFAGYADLVFAG